MKKTLALVLALAMILTLSACGGKSEGGTAQGSETAAGEKYINLCINEDPDSLDPAKYSSLVSIKILRDTQEGLVKNYYHDGAYEIIPGDAESWECSDDGTVWTFHLRDNAKWADGEPITAQQYVYGIQRVVDPNNAGPQSFMIDSIKNYAACLSGDLPVEEIGAKALDDHTLEITLGAPFSAFLQTIAGSVVFPAREDLIEKFGDKFGTEAEYTLSTGPYLLESWVHNSKITLKKNPNYWHQDTIYIDKAEYLITAEKNTLNNAFQAGDLDVIETTDKEWIDLFSQDTHNKVIVMDSSLMMMNFFNCDDPIFKNANIRRAFTFATDLDDFNQVFYSGIRQPLYGIVTPAVGEYRTIAGDPLKAEMEAYAAQGITPKDLLLKGMAELGLGDDPSTLDITLKVGNTTDFFRDYCSYFKQRWDDALGTNIKTSQTEWGIFADDYLSGNYQVAEVSWSGDYADPYATVSIFTSSANSIRSNYFNEEYDAIVAKALVEQDDAKRTDLYMQAEKLAMEDCVISPLVAGTTSVFYKDYLVNYNTAAFITTGLQFVDIQR